MWITNLRSSLGIEKKKEQRDNNNERGSTEDQRWKYNHSHHESLGHAKMTGIPFWCKNLTHLSRSTRDPFM